MPPALPTCWKPMPWAALWHSPAVFLEQRPARSLTSTHGSLPRGRRLSQRAGKEWDRRLTVPEPGQMSSRLPPPVRYQY